MHVKRAPFSRLIFFFRTIYVPNDLVLVGGKRINILFDQIGSRGNCSLPLSLSFSFEPARPPSPLPQEEKIPGNPLILWFFNRPRAIVCVLWQRALSGPIMSVRIKGDSWEPHLVVWKGEAIVVADIEGGNHCARLHCTQLAWPFVYFA